MTKETLNYQLLRLPSGKCDVRFVRIQDFYVVDLRSVFAAAGVTWARWKAAALALAFSQDWALCPHRDYLGRATLLLQAKRVQPLLVQLTPMVEGLFPAAGRRLAVCAREWPASWGKVGGESGVTAPLTPSKPTAPMVAPNQAVNAASGPAVYELEANITHQTQAIVRDLAAKGSTDKEIASMLNISRPSVSLLRRGLYQFGRVAKVSLRDIQRFMSFGNAQPGAATCSSCALTKRTDIGSNWCSRGEFAIFAKGSTCRLHEPLEGATPEQLEPQPVHLPGATTLKPELFDQVKLLLAQGMRQASVARQLKLSKSTVSRIAVGHTTRPNNSERQP